MDKWEYKITWEVKEAAAIAKRPQSGYCSSGAYNDSLSRKP